MTSGNTTYGRNKFDKEDPQETGSGVLGKAGKIRVSGYNIDAQRALNARSALISGGAGRQLSMFFAEGASSLDLYASDLRGEITIENGAQAECLVNHNPGYGADDHRVNLQGSSRIIVRNVKSTFDCSEGGAVFGKLNVFNGAKAKIAGVGRKDKGSSLDDFLKKGNLNSLILTEMIRNRNSNSYYDIQMLLRIECMTR
jgi:hypothetical protein